MERMPGRDAETQRETGHLTSEEKRTIANVTRGVCSHALRGARDRTG